MTTRHYYHGTTTAHLASILREGLRPCAAPGADKWASQQPDVDVTKKMAGRAPAVYLTDSTLQATMFATLAAKVTDSEPAMLKVRLTADEVARLSVDLATQEKPDGSPGAWRYPDVIPPDRLTRERCEPLGFIAAALAPTCGD